MGGLGPKNFSTFGPSDASRKKTIKFHLMQAIAFFSPCFCLSNRVWHEQIVLCTIVTYQNNFKCHGTIFAIFLPQKTHCFLERTHQNLTHRMHDATHCIFSGILIGQSTSSMVCTLVRGVFRNCFVGPLVAFHFLWLGFRLGSTTSYALLAMW